MENIEAHSWRGYVLQTVEWELNASDSGMIFVSEVLFILWIKLKESPFFDPKKKKKKGKKKKESPFLILVASTTHHPLSSVT